MKPAKKLTALASLIVALGVFFVTSRCRAQEPSPAGRAGESRSAGSAGGPAAEAKKEDPGAAPAQFTQGLLEQIGGAKVAMDTMWTLIAGMLVFFMNLGFASVESGLCRAKNTVTILAKNFVVFAASSIAFLGFGLGLDVRRRQSIFRHGRACGLSAARTTVRRWARPIKEFTRRSTGPACRCGRSFSFSWFLPARRRRSFRARSRSESSSARSISSAFLMVGSDLSDRRSLDLGRRLVRPSSACSISPARRWCTRSAVGRR